MQPANVSDYIEIQRLCFRYADAVVHRNGSQWSSTWADDACWDLGGGHLIEGREAITGLWYSAMKGMAAVFQVVHDGEVWEGEELDSATGRWYITEHYTRADGTRGILLAHYDDAYVRHEGRWLFARRLLQPHYGGAPDLSAEFGNTRAALEARDNEGTDV